MCRVALSSRGLSDLLRKGTQQKRDLSWGSEKWPLTLAGSPLSPGRVVICPFPVMTNLRQETPTLSVSVDQETTSPLQWDIAQRKRHLLPPHMTFLNSTRKELLLLKITECTFLKKICIDHHPTICYFHTQTVWAKLIRNFGWFAQPCLSWFGKKIPWNIQVCCHGEGKAGFWHFSSEK